jgi:nitroreductase
MSHTIPNALLLEALNWRYATKQFNATRKISDQDWATLEDVLTLSPSSAGMQPWTFVVVTDPEVRAKLQPAGYGQSQIVEASHLVVFAAKTDVTEADVDELIARTAEVRGLTTEMLAPYKDMVVGGIVKAKDEAGRQAWAARQVYIALGNFLAGAALLGIDACPMEGFVPAQFDEILGLKEKGLTAAVIATVGYRAETDAYATLAKVRFPKEKIILHV